MMRRLALAMVTIALVAGCKGKQKNPDVDSTPLAPGASEGVTGEAMSFDAQGSDSGRIDGLVSINFGYDKSVLDGDAKAKLKSNAAWMKANGAKVQIEGHCDARGSIEYNIALGERRANVVKSYLMSQGIPADRLSTISYGKEKPLVNGDSESAYAKNRRANFMPLQ